jgi:hypothetical protein
MHKAREINDKMYNQAVKVLEKGYSAEDFRVFSQCLDNMLDIHKLSGKEEMDQDDYEVEDTQIDDNIKEMSKYFYMYVEAKKDYHRYHTDDMKKKCTMYLEKFISAMTGMVMELVSSSDFQEERDMIKMKLKEIFSNV